METLKAPLYHQLMGLYHTLIADQGLADEGRWPSDMLPLEREARRRLFWHMYRLEVHTALIIGHTIRCPEIQIAVEYPSDPVFDLQSTNSDLEWLTGWNFVTDLYRGLEHLLVHFRSRRTNAANAQKMQFVVSHTLTDESRAALLTSLEIIHEALPRRFKEPAEMSGDIDRNRCVYQTANIICTYQLLKLLSYASGNVTFHDACQTVLQLVESISAIPNAFLRSMSLAMVQELSGFGHILGSFIGKPLTVDNYQQLKAVM
ncbi:hypothetical protein BDV96DRAFT_639266 [Lophiotrema nucula]|uniref:Xylanolytic transcriptional activator regulatory domain-containing protein n=1 Tax=Lophiotrema nucula TaxID=690887 RepID=A0A6A5ZWE7_9PLEO|nr:hypothetical protein BDV96DRAFT_639266 [Lophiotrema nucula]